MKNKFSLLTLAALTAASVAMISFTGCAGSPAEQEGVIGVAAAATAAVVRNNPQSVPDFQAGQIVLNELAANPVALSTNNIDAILKQIGQTNAAAASVAASTILFITPLINNATNVIQQQQLLVNTLEWTSTGIGVGIPLGEALAASKK